MCESILVKEENLMSSSDSGTEEAEVQFQGADRPGAAVSRM